MKKMKTSFLIALFAIVLSNTLFAQISTPRTSPAAKVTQTVGLSDVTIEYFRPSLKGRKAFGDVVPYGSMWRTGANSGTFVTFGDDVIINNNKVAKGTYIILSIPTEKEWTVIFNKNTKLAGNDPKDYKVEDDVARFTTKAMPTMPTVESFTMAINNVKPNGATIDIIWENSIISVPFTVDTDSKVMASIKSKIDGPTGNDYYQAASYYFDNKKDIVQAKKWMDMACEKGACNRYWVMRMKGQIYAEAGDKKGAIEAFTQSLNEAKKENDAAYIKMNEKSLNELK
ncbi:MAG: DUF2911 domain-containing protein [Saprospiraceae bacterium]|nr:DUF2911 domain-containing protein [Saprospiraceae bacterium]